MCSQLPSESPLQTMQLGGQSLPHTGFGIQNASTGQFESNAGGRLRRSSETSISTSLEGVSQLYGSDVERCQHIEHNPFAESMSTTLNMAPARQVPPTFDTSQPVSSRLATSGAGSLASVRSKMLPQVPDAGTEAVRIVGRPYRQNSKDHVVITSYAFLDTDFLSSIPPEDLEYLDHLGCLQLPQRDSLDELVRAYFLYVHSHLPLIDEGNFWDTYLSRQFGVRGASRMSLFVFQAMLLVACSVSDFLVHLPQVSGFTSLRSCRRGIRRCYV
jgi:hypothetical protein